MPELAYALDSWNTNVLIQKKMPPRNEKGLKAYTKNFGKLAKDFGLTNIKFNDAIDAYRSLPYSLPEFKNFPIPESATPILKRVDEKTTAIAGILDYYIKDGQPETIYKEEHPYLQHARVLLAYRDVGLELFDKSKRLNHLFPSVAVLWGCLLVGEIRFMLSDSQVTDCIFGESLPHLGFSKRTINNEVVSTIDHLKGERINKEQETLEPGTEPYLILWQDLKTRRNNKQRKYELKATENIFSAIKRLNQLIKNDPLSIYYWMDGQTPKHTGENAPKTLTNSPKI